MWAKWLHHPCRLGGPQRSTRGQESEMATWPTCGQRGYITHAVPGIPNAKRADRNQKWLLGPHVGKRLHHPCSLSVANVEGREKNEKWLLAAHLGNVAASPLPIWGPSTLSAKTKIGNGYITPVMLGIGNAHCGDKNKNMWARWLHHPCRLGGPEHSSGGQKVEITPSSTCGQSGYITHAVWGAPNAKRGTKIRNGYPSHIWAKCFADPKTTSLP